MSIRDEYDFNYIQETLERCTIDYNIEQSNIPKEEKKMINGLARLIYCPLFVTKLNAIFGHELSPLEKLHIIMPNIPIDPDQSVHENLLNLPWKSKQTKICSKDPCGSCYRWLSHGCKGEKCTVCPGNGFRMVSCKNCSKIKHHCTICKNGYIVDEEKRLVCPNIEKMDKCKKCLNCYGKPNETHKRCKGSCQYFQYSTLKSGEKKLSMGCACGRPHQIGDCPGKWKNKKTGRISNSPYQQWTKCPDCYYYHPIIFSFKYLSDYEQIVNVDIPTTNIIVDGRKTPAIKTKDGLVPAINIRGKWLPNKFAAKTRYGWTIRRNHFGRRR